MPCPDPDPNPDPKQGSAPATESDETGDDESFSNQSPQLDSLRSSTESTSGGAAGVAPPGVAPHPGSGRGGVPFSALIQL